MNLFAIAKKLRSYGLRQEQIDVVIDMIRDLVITRDDRVLGFKIPKKKKAAASAGGK